MLDLSDITSLESIGLLRESVDLECKLARGRDGQGALPEDFWPTYSAFANTNGGIILLGVRETQGTLRAEGIPDAAKVRTDLFVQLNNRQKVSCNLLTDASAQELTIDGQTILVIQIPRAPHENNDRFS